MKNKLRLIKNIYLKKNKPISLIIFLTERCNARCSFCFIDFDNPKFIFLSLIVTDLNPDMVVNDVLNTTDEFILNLKEQGIVVVNFEDLGSGSDHADIVFNELYKINKTILFFFG